METIQEVHAALFISVSIGAWAMGLGSGLLWVTIAKVLDVAK